MLINGAVHEIPQTPLQEAQARLQRAGMKQPLTAEGAAVSAYVNGLLHSARLSALIEYTLEPNQNATWTPQERFESIFVRELNAKAELLESTARRAPLILAASSVAGHG